MKNNLVVLLFFVLCSNVVAQDVAEVYYSGIPFQLSYHSTGNQLYSDFKDISDASQKEMMIVKNVC